MMDTANLSSNWKKLQASASFANPSTSIATALKHKSLPASQTSVHTTKRKRHQPTGTPHTPSYKRVKTGTMETPIENALQTTSSINAGLSQTVEVGKYIALDCEMVGVGLSGKESALARVSIVNYNGDQVYDSFVKPKEEVTDWRTAVSGIKPSHMSKARTFEEVQTEVAGILKDRVVVGHALKHDFKVLLLDHPLRDVRDTSHFAPYKKLAGGTPKLQLLASELLGLEIQGGEHSSLEDARACMLLFHRDKDAFESKSKIKKRVR